MDNLAIELIEKIYLHLYLVDGKSLSITCKKNFTISGRMTNFYGDNYREEVIPSGFIMHVMDH